MNIRTFALTLAAPRNAVFNFLANIENLPLWAGAFCERVYLQRGGWWALTIEGELMVDLDIHAAAGVIDVNTGASHEHLTPLPIRVVALSAHRTLLSFVVIERPDESLEKYEHRCLMLASAGRKLVQRFGSGEVHAKLSPKPQLAELGLN